MDIRYDVLPATDCEAVCTTALNVFNVVLSAEAINALVDSVENEIFRRSDREISSTTIGNVLMDHLKKLDGVAYVRFASVYREFKDVNTLMEELKDLMEKTS